MHPVLPGVGAAGGGVETVRAVAAGMGVTLREVVGDLRLRAQWHTSRAVLLSAEALGDVHQLALPRRQGMALLGEAPSGDALNAALRLGVEQVLPEDAEEIGKWLGTATQRGSAADLLVFTSASGGAGASTLAAATARRAAADSAEVLLILTDPWSAPAWVMLGADPSPGLGWSALMRAGGRVSATSLRESLPADRGVSWVGWSPGDASVEPDEFAEVLSRLLEAARTAFDLVVVDVGRGLDCWEVLVPLADRHWVVARPTIRGAAAAAALLARLAAAGSDERARLVLRGRGHDDASTHQLLGVDPAVRLRSVRHLDELLDLGVGAEHRHLRRAAGEVLADLDVLPQRQAVLEPVSLAGRP